MAPTVVLDAGIATEENLAWLTKHGYRYLVVSRERHKQFDARPPGIGFFQPFNRLNRHPNRRLLDKFPALKKYDDWTIVSSVD